jgi:hypothetical protein
MRKPIAAGILAALIGTSSALMTIDPWAATPASLTGLYKKALAPRNAFAPNQLGVQRIEDYGSFALFKVDDTLLAGVSSDVQVNDEADVLQFTAHPFDTQRDTLSAPSPFSLHAPFGPGLQVIQFVGPVKQAWLDTLTSLGVKPVQYVASNGYIVWADSGAQARLATLRAQSSWLQYAAPFYGFLKVDPSLQTRIVRNAQDDEVDVVVQVYRHDGVDATRTFVESKGVVPPNQLGPIGSGAAPYVWAPILSFENLRLRVHVADIPAIAERPDVTSVGAYGQPQMLDEKQGIIMAGDFAPGPATPSYLQFLLDRGFSENPADYPIVDVTDSPVDEGGTGDTVVATADNLLHVQGQLAQPSRVAYFANCSALATEATGGSDGHGSLNGSIIADYDQRTGFPFQDDDGQHLGLGINPFGRIGSTAIFVPVFNIDRCGGTDQGVILSNWQSGAKISSNSWGAPIGGLYDGTAQAYDAGVRDADPATAGNQQLIYVFSAGNEGPDESTIGSPGTAKNVITVGASENLRPFPTPPDNICGPDAASNPHNVVDFSSRGPAQGGRVKPDVLAPGTHIQAGASVFSGYDGSGVCVKYFPESPAQQIFTYSSGTSHSAPAVAGVASLAYWWIEHGGGGAAAGSVNEIGGNRAPSPALMKAWLIAHPSYLDGTGGNDALPSEAQGYGMPNASAMFDDTPKLIDDQSETFDNTGETRSYTLGVADPTKPVRIALAYTDAPGALGVGSLVNDLDLAVVANGDTFRGNHFDRGRSVTGGSADRKNNVEAVFLDPGTTGDLTITVTAANIAGDGVPNAGDLTDQDFALVCSNCLLSPTYTLTTPELAPSVCVGRDFSADVALDSIDDFASRIDLALAGAPAGTQAQVDPSSVTPPGTATVSVTDSGNVAPGHYPLVLTGTSGSIVKTLEFDLTYVPDVPGAPLLAEPNNGAANVDLQPTLVWNAATDASTYLVEIATDAEFRNVVVSTEVRETSLTVSSALDSSTQYFWRVTAKNGCGDSGSSDSDGIFADGFDSAAAAPSQQSVFTFTTLALPGDCPADTTKQVLFSEDVESGAPGWRLGGDANANHWTIDGPAHGGVHAFRADNVQFVGTPQPLLSPAIVLPPGLSPVTLSFFNQQSLQDFDATTCLDGAILEISENGGPFTQIVDGLLTDPYDGFISPNFSNPLGSRPAWCGNPQPYLNSVVDLTPYAGHSVELRFTMGNFQRDELGEGPPNPGWAIDDVKVIGCTPN